MTIKKLQNNFTTPEQSKRLLELGVPADSADCYYSSTFHNIIVLNDDINKNEFFRAILPVWSYGRLIEIWLKCNMFSIEHDSEPVCISKADYEDFGNEIIKLIAKTVGSKYLDFSKLEE